MPRLLAWIKPFSHWLAMAILLAAGWWAAARQTYLLVALMLLLPLLDSGWRPPGLRKGWRQWTLIALLLLAGTTLLIWRPAQLEFAAATLFTAALPEEWFFRAYLMPRIGRGLGANLVTSLLFSLLHGLTRGPVIGLQVLLPSLCFGWCYQRSGNLMLVVLVHALSNLVFVLFLAQWF